MPPPYLAADTPIANVLQPLCVNFFPMLGEEPDQVIAYHRQGFFCFWIAQEPLLADTRLDWHIAALAEPDIVLVRLRFCQRSTRLQ